MNADFSFAKKFQERAFTPEVYNENSRIQAPKGHVKCLIGTVAKGLHQPHNEAIGSQLNMPKGLSIFGVIQKFSNLMYLATNYMEKYVELVQLPSLHAPTHGAYHLTYPKRAYQLIATHLTIFCARTLKIGITK